MYLKDPYLESLRYLENVRLLLREKAGKSGQFYRDTKYVKLACNTAYSGLLIALSAALLLKASPKNRLSVEDNRNALGSRNRKMLQVFNSAYNYLHLLGGYDGDLNVLTSKEGLRLAEQLIEWCRPILQKQALQAA